MQWLTQIVLIALDNNLKFVDCLPLLHDQFVLLTLWGVWWEHQLVTKHISEHKNLNSLRINLVMCGEEFSLKLDEGVYIEDGEGGLEN